MFKKARNLETAFQYMRLYSLVMNICAFGFCVWISVRADRKVREARAMIYILSSGKALEAFAADRKENLPVEARDHIKTFHLDFFTLEPDEKLIAENITRALYLADGSAKRLYDNLKESGYYAGIVSGNISQSLRVDSIALDMTGYPYAFRCYATQTITRSTSLVTRSLVTGGWLRNTVRSERCPHGFLVERWSIIENKDIKVEEK